MEGVDQARAYAAADFAEPHQAYVRLFDEVFPDGPRAARVLDLGCGPCDVTIRFARAHRHWIFDAVDGSIQMLHCAAAALRRAENRKHSIRLVAANLSETGLPRGWYDVILASSVLHHLPEPKVLWRTILDHAKPGARVFVPDLRRPENESEARSLVERHASGESDILRHDFYHSLLAAFTVEEVQEQLQTAGLRTMSVRSLDDRHLLAWGSIS